MKKILLVDDECEFRTISEKFLSRKGFKVLLAEHCAAACDLLVAEAENVSVVIMDVSMPGKDGIACMKEIKASWPHLEVIILTGHASLEVSINGMKRGAFDYCMKPLDYEELMEKIVLAQESARVNFVAEEG